MKEKLMHIARAAKICLSGILIICLSVISLIAQDTSDSPWQVELATLRFEVEITQPPTDPSAGILCVLPDGGILPTPHPKPLAYSQTGKPILCESFWHNPARGFGLILEPTGERRAFVYFIPSHEEIAAPASIQKFKPGVLLFARNGNASLKLSHELAEKPAVGNNILFCQTDAILRSVSPIGIDKDLSSYYLGWFRTPRKGKTYFFTISKDGSEIYVDRKLVHSWPGIHNRNAGMGAQQGNWIFLNPGLHRVEYFHFNISPNDREVQLGWQLPGAPQVDDPDFPGMKNKNYTFPMNPKDFVHSGVATVRSVQSRKGPQAVFAPHLISYLYTTNYFLCLYEFKAFGTEDHPPETIYEWDFGEQHKVKGQDTLWLYSGRETHYAALTISAGGYASHSKRAFYPKPLENRAYTTNADECAMFSAAYAIMCKSVPREIRRPAQGWNIRLWCGLLDIANPLTDNELLNCIFAHSRKDILMLPESMRWSLEDKFYEALCISNQKDAPAWLNQFIKEEKNLKRQGEWKARTIEFYLYSANDFKSARIVAIRFMQSATSPYLNTLAMIRMGDVARISGNFQRARELYSKAQEYYQRWANIKKPVLQERKKHTSAAQQSFAPRELTPKIDNWKIAAVHKAAYAATMQSLIQQDLLDEAKQTLAKWEMEFPLNKLAGVYPLAEATYYMARKNYNRAQQILMNYRKSVDMSNYLPAAMKMEMQCLVYMKQHDEAKKLLQLIIKRLPKHPVADEARALLAEEDLDKAVLAQAEAEKDIMTPWEETEDVDVSLLINLFGGAEQKETQETKSPDNGK